MITKEKNKITIGKYYRYYKENVNEPLPYEEWYDVIMSFNNFLGEKLLEGNMVKLNKMGVIYIRGRKQKPKPEKDETGRIKGMAINWGKTYKLWEKDPKAKEEKRYMYYLNEHSDGIRYRIVYAKKDVLAFNKSCYSFRAVKKFKTKLYNRIVSGQRYPIWEGYEQTFKEEK